MWYTYVYGILSPHCDSFCQKQSQYGEKIPYTYVYHIFGYLGNCEALQEIMDLVHEMLSVCALATLTSPNQNQTIQYIEFQIQIQIKLLNTLHL